MKNKKKIEFSILEIIFIGLIVYSGYNIFKWNIDNKNTSKIMDVIVESTTLDEENKLIVDFKALKDQNPDTVGYIIVNNTNIYFPVVKANDNEYYLTHSYDKKPNKAGWIFADYKNNFDETDKNIVIYGHNRRDGSMFSTLKNI